MTTVATPDNYIAKACRSFSNPLESFADEVFESTATEFSRGVSQRFISKYSKLLHQSTPGLESLVQDWYQSDVDFDSAWEPVFGVLGEILASRSLIHPEIAAVRLGLTILSHGSPGSLSFSLDSPLRTRFGKVAIPPAKNAVIISDGKRATVKFDEGPQLELNRDVSGMWSSSQAQNYFTLPIEKRQLTFLLDEALTAPEFAFLRDDLASEDQIEAAKVTFAGAFNALREFAPEYLTWIDRVMRYVIPLKGGDGRIVSGSTRGDLGVSHISRDAHPAAIAEMLVHESSHQYYYLATRLQPVDDGSDETLYFSPVKQRGRPINYIHLAYHAFGNVVLMGREMRSRGYRDEDGYLETNERELVPQLEVLDQGLRTTEALTGVGHALWSPLRERLNSP